MMHAAYLVSQPMSTSTLQARATEDTPYQSGPSLALTNTFFVEPPCGVNGDLIFKKVKWPCKSEFGCHSEQERLPKTL